MGSEMCIRDSCCCLAHFVNNIQLSPEEGVNSNGYKQRRERSRYISSSLLTDLEGDSCFSVYQISWKKMKKVTFCKLKCHLVGTLFTIYKHFRDFVKCIFTILLQI